MPDYTIVKTSGSSITIPADAPTGFEGLVPVLAVVHLIGGGQAGYVGALDDPGLGGYGGDYSTISFTPDVGASHDIQVGQGGDVDGASGTDSWFKDVEGSIICLAKGGNSVSTSIGSLIKTSRAPIAKFQHMDINGNAIYADLTGTIGGGWGGVGGSGSGGPSNDGGRGGDSSWGAGAINGSGGGAANSAYDAPGDVPFQTTGDNSLTGKGGGRFNPTLDSLTLYGNDAATNGYGGGGGTTATGPLAGVGGKGAVFSQQLWQDSETSQFYGPGGGGGGGMAGWASTLGTQNPSSEAGGDGGLYGGGGGGSGGAPPVGAENPQSLGGDWTLYGGTFGAGGLGADGLVVLVLTYAEGGEEEPSLVGGSGTQLEPLGCVVRAQPYALEVRDLNSILELGPFRFVEQKESDETSMITTLVLGLTEVDIGIAIEIDLSTASDLSELNQIFGSVVDLSTQVDVLDDDVEIDMGEGVDNSDDFTLELLGNDDGSTYPGPPIEFKPEVLSPIDDRGSTKQYSPTGYSFIYHRVRLKATEIDEKFQVKFVDISGQLTGRLM